MVPASASFVVLFRIASASAFCQAEFPEFTAKASRKTPREIPGFHRRVFPRKKWVKAAPPFYRRHHGAALPHPFNRSGEHLPTPTAQSRRSGHRAP